MHPPAVDVIIPIYNSEATLEEAVSSIQAQSYSNIRVFLVDDGSYDSTPDIIARLSASDKRIVALHKENGGIVDALNLACLQSDAPLIARHDADDIAAPDRFRKQIAYLDQHPEVIAVSGSAREIDTVGKPTGAIISFGSPDLADPNWLSAREPYLLHPFLMLRRTALEAVGGYRHVFHAEDADLYWRLQELGKLANMRDILGDYRLNPSSVSSRSVINGRIQSVSSQLAAISAIRRRAQEADLVFPASALKQYEAVGDLENIITLASAQLSLQEQGRLGIAVADKLNRLSSYRPYELEVKDYHFIARMYRAVKSIQSVANQREISQRLRSTIVALVLRRKFSAALALCPPALYLECAIYTALKLTLPKTAIILTRRIRARLAF